MLFWGGVVEGGGSIVSLSLCGFSQVCMMGRERSLSSLCQLTLPVTGCLPLIHTPLQQSAQKRGRGKNTPDSFLFSRAAFILPFPSTVAHASCLKHNISYSIDWHKVLIGFIMIFFFSSSELLLTVWCSQVSLWPYVCVFNDNWGT